MGKGVLAMVSKETIWDARLYAAKNAIMLYAVSKHMGKRIAKAVWIKIVRMRGGEAGL